MGKGKGKLVIFRHDNLGRGAIEAAYHWAMLVEPGEYAKPLRVISPLSASGLRTSCCYAMRYACSPACEGREDREEPTGKGQGHQRVPQVGFGSPSRLFSWSVSRAVLPPVHDELQLRKGKRVRPCSTLASTWSCANIMLRMYV
jgi:hypothetical protein